MLCSIVFVIVFSREIMNSMLRMDLTLIVFRSTNLLCCMKSGLMRLAVANRKRIYFGNIVEMRILCVHNIKILVRGLVQPLV